MASEDGEPPARHERLLRLPQFRLESILGWMLLAAGAGGWGKYHLDLSNEEAVVLKALAAERCDVDVVRSLRDANTDGRYSERRWYEPAFLERIGELKVHGDAPAELLLRAASLPGLTLFDVEDITWHGRERPAEEVVGQPMPQLPPETLTTEDWITDELQGDRVEGEEYETILSAVRESWTRKRELPERVLVHAFESATAIEKNEVRYDDRVRTLTARSGECSLTQVLGSAPVYLIVRSLQTGVRTDIAGTWTLSSRGLDVRDPGGRFDQVYRRLAETVSQYSADGLDPVPYEIGYLAGLSGGVEDPAMRRLDDGTVRIDVLRTLREDDEYGVTIEREATSFVVQESTDWLPIARRRTTTVEGVERRDRQTMSEAYRYVDCDGRILVAETLRTAEGSEGYRYDSHIRCAYDVDPTFDATTFDAKRLVGPALAEPGTYPFRWYRLPLIAGVAFIAVRLMMRIGSRFRSR